MKYPSKPAKNSPQASPAQRLRLAPRQVRIIGGQWKRSVLSVIDTEGLRPTPDRVRETVFNWFNHLLDQNWASLRCLDLFAGSGALGIEAASRGAAQVLLLENQADAHRQIQQVLQKLNAQQCQVMRTDALVYLAKAPANCFDMIFLDPPFACDYLQKAIPACDKLLTANGYLYVEAEFDLASVQTQPEWQTILQNWQIIRQDQAGQVYFHILQRSKISQPGAETQA